MKKEFIKQEALLLFVKESYEGCSMSEIAKKVGLRTPSLYSHFESKEQLFLTILQEVIDEKISNLEEIKNETSNQSIKKLLHTILLDKLNDIETNKVKTVFYRRYSLFPPSQLKEKIQSRMLVYEKAIYNLLTPAIEKGIKQRELKEGNPDKILEAFYCVMDGLYILSHYRELDTYRNTVENVWSLYWESVKN